MLQTGQLPDITLHPFKAAVQQHLVKTLPPGSSPEDVKKAISEEVAQRAMQERHMLTPSQQAQLIQEIIHDMLGLGPLEPLLADATVSEIMVNGHEAVWVEQKGQLHRTEVRFDDEAHLMRIIHRIVGRIGRRVDESSPMVDARLPDGSRVNAIIPPLAIDGPTLTIRKFAKERLGPHQLIELGSMTEGMALFLQRCAEIRCNILISGGTGSGKTTLLNILSSYIPDGERLVTIEDAAELQLQKEHVVRLETRPANQEGNGAVPMDQLLRNSLRMRPDRIIIGEVRGPEALTMLQAMNTGHEGSMTTIHANSTRDALSRMETMVLMATGNLPLRAIREQIASAIDLIVQIERLSDGTRRITSISELVGQEGDVITMQEIFHYKKQGIDPMGFVKGQHRPTGIRPRAVEKFQLKGLEFPFHYLQADL